MNRHLNSPSTSASASAPSHFGNADAAERAAASIQIIKIISGDDQYDTGIVAAPEIGGSANITDLPKQPEEDARSAFSLRSASAAHHDQSARALRRGPNIAVPNLPPPKGKRHSFGE